MWRETIRLYMAAACSASNWSQQDWLPICYSGWNFPWDIFVFNNWCTAHLSKSSFFLSFESQKRKSLVTLLMLYRVRDIEITFRFYWKIELFDPVLIPLGDVQKHWINIYWHRSHRRIAISKIEQQQQQNVLQYQSTTDNHDI